MSRSENLEPEANVGIGQAQDMLDIFAEDPYFQIHFEHNEILQPEQFQTYEEDSLGNISTKSKLLADLVLAGKSVGVATGRLINSKGQRLDAVEMGRRSFTSLECLQYRAWEADVPLPRFKFGSIQTARVNARVDSSRSDVIHEDQKNQANERRQRGREELKALALKELYRVSNEILVTPADVARFERKYPPLKPLLNAQYCVVSIRESHRFETDFLEECKASEYAACVSAHNKIQDHLDQVMSYAFKLQSQIEEDLKVLENRAAAVRPHDNCGAQILLQERGQIRSIPEVSPSSPSPEVQAPLNSNFRRQESSGGSSQRARLSTFPPSRQMKQENRVEEATSMSDEAMQEMEEDEGKGAENEKEAEEAFETEFQEGDMVMNENENEDDNKNEGTNENTRDGGATVNSSVAGSEAGDHQRETFGDFLATKGTNQDDLPNEIQIYSKEDSSSPSSSPASGPVPFDQYPTGTKSSSFPLADFVTEPNTQGEDTTGKGTSTREGGEPVGMTESGLEEFEAEKIQGQPRSDGFASPPELKQPLDEHARLDSKVKKFKEGSLRESLLVSSQRLSFKGNDSVDESSITLASASSSQDRTSSQVHPEDGSRSQDQAGSQRTQLDIQSRKFASPPPKSSEHSLSTRPASQENPSPIGQSGSSKTVNEIDLRGMTSNSIDDFEEAESKNPIFSRQASSRRFLSTDSRGAQSSPSKRITPRKRSDPESKNEGKTLVKRNKSKLGTDPEELKSEGDPVSGKQPSILSFKESQQLRDRDMDFHDKEAGEG